MELSPRCEKDCPLVGTRISEYPIGIGRNCDGPVPAQPGDIAEARILVEKDGHAERNEVLSVIPEGRMMCRNRVAMKAIDLLVAIGK